MAMTSWPTVAVELNTTRDPNDPNGTDTWVNITPDVVGWSLTRGRIDELADVQAGTLTLKIKNQSGNYDPTNAAGAYYPNVRAGRQLRLSAAWPASYVTDTFSRPNSTTALGVADSGQTWSSLQGGTLGINGNQCYTSAVTDSIAVLNVGSSDCVATITMQVVDGTWDVLARVVDVNNFYMTQFSTGGVNLYKRVAGTYTSVGFFTHTFTPGDRYGISVNGTTISALVNDVAVITVTDSSVAGGTKAGIRYGTGGGTTGRVSHFEATPIGQVRYPLFQGYEDSFWPQTYEHEGRYAYANPVFVDAFSWLARIDLLDCVVNEMLVDGPLALYPLSDSQGSQQAGNISGTKQANATIIPPRLPDSASSGLATFGQAGAIPTSSADGLTLATTMDTNFASNAGSILNLPSTAAPAGTGGFTVEFWMTTTAWAGITGVLLTVGDSSAGSSSYTTFNDGAGLAFIPVTGGTSVSATFSHAGTGAGVAATTVIDDGQAHHFALTLDAARTHGTLYVDGVSAGSTAFGGTMTQTALNTVLLGHLEFAVASGAKTVTTTIALPATYTTPLSAARIKAHYTAGLNAFAGEVPSGHLTRLLSYAAWLPALENIDTTSVGDSNSPQQGLTDIGGKNVLQAMLAITKGVLADLDVDGQGKVRYRSRDYRLLQTTPAVTFGEGPAAGGSASEVPYTTPPTTGAQVEKIYPQVEIDQVNGITIMRGDATSALRYGPQQLSLSTYMQDPGMVIDLADHLIRTYKDAAERASGFDVNPAANPSVWPQVLGLDLGLRARVFRRPGIAPSKQIECYVEGFTHTVTPSSWVVSAINTSAAPPFFPWILGDAVYSVLGVTTVPCF